MKIFSRVIQMPSELGQDVQYAVVIPQLMMTALKWNIGDTIKVEIDDCVLILRKIVDSTL